MFFLKSFYCRVYQLAFRVVLPILPYREPEIVGSCLELNTVLKKENDLFTLYYTGKKVAILLL